VLRDGQWVNPPARELVPGDIIRLRLGDIVPADARLLEGDPVEVDQSALTGESLPATCGPGDSVFSASIIRQGEIGASSTPRARTRTSARPPSSSRTARPSVTSSAPC